MNTTNQKEVRPYYYHFWRGIIHGWPNTVPGTSRIRNTCTGIWIHFRWNWFLLKVCKRENRKIMDIKKGECV